MEASSQDRTLPPVGEYAAWARTASIITGILAMIASLSGGELASEACQKTDHADWEMLTIFAAAFAEAGNYDQAIYWCRHALHEAPLQDQPAIETMLAGFRNRTPCRW